MFAKCTVDARALTAEGSSPDVAKRSKVEEKCTVQCGNARGLDCSRAQYSISCGSQLFEAEAEAMAVAEVEAEAETKTVWPANVMLHTVQYCTVPCCSQTALQVGLSVALGKACTASWSR